MKNLPLDQVSANQVSSTLQLTSLFAVGRIPSCFSSRFPEERLRRYPVSERTMEKNAPFSVRAREKEEINSGGDERK